MSLDMHSYKWVHPVCGHETPLTNNPDLDLAVPYDMLAELNLPPAGLPMDMYKSSCHPANQKYLHESNPAAARPPDKTFDVPAGQSSRYGGFDVTINPMNAPMGNMHPFMNEGMDLNPAKAIQAGLDFGGKRDGGVDSMSSLGWPGPHLECPTCVREKQQRDFDEINVRMQQADIDEQDWAPQARLLAQELCKLQRAKQPMALVINPTPHPEEPPLIRGPKAADIMRNVSGYPVQDQKLVNAMHHTNSHANQSGGATSSMHNATGRLNQFNKTGNRTNNIDGRLNQSQNAANVMHNASGNHNPGGMHKMQHQLGNQFDVSSPANQVPSFSNPGGFFTPSSFDMSPHPGSQFAGSGAVPIPAVFPQPPMQSRIASNPQFAPRSNDRPTGVNDNLVSTRVGHLANASGSTSDESASSESNEIAANGWGTQDIISNAFQKVATQHRQKQGDGIQGHGYSPNRFSLAPGPASPAFNPMAQGFQVDYGLASSGFFAPGTAKGNAGHRGRAGSKTQSSAQPLPASTVSRKTGAKQPGGSGNKVSGMLRTHRSTKAIPIVDPSTSQVKSVADSSDKTSPKNTLAARRKATQNAQGEAQSIVPGDFAEADGMPVTPNKSNKTSDAARTQYSKFKDNNSFSALSVSDDTDVEPGTPGGVKV